MFCFIGCTSFQISLFLDLTGSSQVSLSFLSLVAVISDYVYWTVAFLCWNRLNLQRDGC